MLWLLFLFFNLAVSSETSAVLFCVPHALKITDGNVLSKIDGCLTNNFIRIQNRSVLSTYVDAYDNALEAKLASEKADDDLFLSKHEMTITMRDLRIQASRHIHAVESCSAISHKMPSMIVDLYTDEAQMMFHASDVWMHHIQVDLRRCNQLMKQIVTQSHRHAAHHLQTIYIKHKHLLDESAVKHTEEMERLQLMLDARQVIVDVVNT